MLSLAACADKPVPIDVETPSANEETPSTSKETPSVSKETPITSKETPDDPTIPSAHLATAPDTPVEKTPSPKIEGVYSDFSAYTPYTYTNDEIYTRLSEDFLPELIPSNSYGTLVPYIGEYFCDLDDSDFVMFGLCPTDGMIVTDPVYKDVELIIVYSDYQGHIEFPAYKLELLMAENENMYLDMLGAGRGEPEDEQTPAEYVSASNKPRKGIPNIAACALDGSWATDYYYEADYYEDFMLLHRENDADVFDYNGKFLYNTRDLNVDIQLNDDPSFEWANHIYDYREGYFLLHKWILARQGDEDRIYGLYAFVNEHTGEAYVLDYEYVYAFHEGRAAVMQGGLWGYVNTDMELVIDLQFEDAERFIEGLARCRLPSGKYVLITKDGKVTVESDQYLSNPAEKSYFDWLEESEFIYDPYGGTDVRDRNGIRIFKYDGRLNYLEQARMFALSRYSGYAEGHSVMTTFELLDTKGKCVFRKNVASQWRDD